MLPTQTGTAMGQALPLHIEQMIELRWQLRFRAAKIAAQKVCQDAGSASATTGAGGLVLTIPTPDPQVIRPVSGHSVSRS